MYFCKHHCTFQKYSNDCTHPKQQIMRPASAFTVQFYIAPISEQHPVPCGTASFRTAQPVVSLARVNAPTVCALREAHQLPNSFSYASSLDQRSQLPSSHADYRRPAHGRHHCRPDSLASISRLPLDISRPGWSLCAFIRTTLQLVHCAFTYPLIRHTVTPC